MYEPNSNFSGQGQGVFKSPCHLDVTIMNVLHDGEGTWAIGGLKHNVLCALLDKRALPPRSEAADSDAPSLSAAKRKSLERSLLATWRALGATPYTLTGTAELIGIEGE